MKRFIFSIIAVFMIAISAFAQEQSNYAGSSRFTDNWSVTVQGGVVTPFNEMFSNGSTMPLVMVGANKEVTPWLGFGIDARTAIGTGSKYNSYTAFDAVNVSANIRFNMANVFTKYTGERKLFEPIVYTGIGWGHFTASKYDWGYNRNYMTYRAGVEFDFNLGKNRAWAVLVNPSVVWGDMANMKLHKNHGNFELTAGFVYRFKNSNGKRSMSVAHLYDATEVARLTQRIAELESRKPEVVERVVEKVVTNTSVAVQTTWAALFKHDSSELTERGKEILKSIPQNVTVDVDAYASREPRSNDEYNVQLSERRANVVKEYLVKNGVTVRELRAHGCDDDYGRAVIVTLVQ